MSFNDSIDTLTGLQIKRVQSITGAKLHEPEDYYESVMAIDYIKTVPRDRLIDWVPEEHERAFLEHQAAHEWKEVAERIIGTEPVVDPKDDASEKLAQFEADQLAQFCMLTGQPPTVFYELTLMERNAFVSFANKRSRKKR